MCAQLGAAMIANPISVASLSETETSIVNNKRVSTCYPEELCTNTVKSVFVVYYFYVR